MNTFISDHIDDIESIPVLMIIKKTSSRGSSMSTNEERIGGQYEFEQMIQRYEEKHSK